MPRPCNIRQASLLALLCLPSAAVAVLPTGKLDVYSNAAASDVRQTWLVSQASFGTLPSMDRNPRRAVALPPDDNPFLCDAVEAPTVTDNAMMLVPRGLCTFQVKALRAQALGASGVLVYGNLANRYGLNQTVDDPTVDDILWPENRYDYDCHRGHAMVPVLDFSFDPLPYNAQQNDPLLTGDTDDSLCHLYSDNRLRNCESKMCLLTGNKSTSGDKLEACCAWDLPIWLYADPSLSDPNSTSYTEQKVLIPAAYLTTQQGNQLLQLVNTGSSVEVVLSSRWRPQYNFSSALIWLLGVFVCALAAYMSAADYRWSYRRHRALASTAEASGNSQNGTQAQQNQRLPTLDANEESLELSPWHALGFIVMASSGLLILFFFKIYAVVKVMYTVGCSSAMVQVLFRPLVAKVARKLKVKNKIVWRTETDDFGDITIFDLVSSFVGFGIGLSWLYIAMTVRHADQLPYFWVVQDIMGACMCIVFLGIIKLNSIKVASILLIVAFLYDIFFVFITPLIFHGESVMITVATSGGPPKGDPSLCEKYPDEPDCQGGDPLPMLLTMPRFFDYMGGASLLGLGDIVLPGLLLSFGARFDGAKALVGLVSGGRGTLSSHSCPERRYCFSCNLCSGGYFPPLVVAYAIGLLMANVAVYVMQMGQPALLYLVPCTLGTMSFMGWRRGELRDLWNGPRALVVADQITYEGQLPDRAVTSPANNDTEDPLHAPETGDTSNADAAPLLNNPLD